MENFTLEELKSRVHQFTFHLSKGDWENAEFNLMDILIGIRLEQMSIRSAMATKEDIEVLRNEMRTGFALITNKLQSHDELFLSIDKRFESIDRRFESIDKRFESIDRRFESIDKRFESIEKRFESIDRRFESIDKRFESIDKRFESIDKRFDSLQWMIGLGFSIMGFILTMLTALIGYSTFIK
jgi:chaperonin cofactor prefoldin